MQKTVGIYSPLSILKKKVMDGGREVERGGGGGAARGLTGDGWWKWGDRRAEAAPAGGRMQGETRRMHCSWIPTAGRRGKGEARQGKAASDAAKLESIFVWITLFKTEMVIFFTVL